jgi:hypothetical protein
MPTMEELGMTGVLDHLFDAELHYEAGSEVVYRTEAEGELIGSGAGSIRGSKLRGSIRWSFYAAECAFDPSGATRPTNDSLCRTGPGGVIELEDGARIWFEARGYGLRLQARAPIWQLTAALRFATQDPRYGWLNESVGIWEGDFDEARQRSFYRAYLKTARSADAAHASADEVLSVRSVR